MDLDLTRRDRSFIGVIYGIPVAVLVAALVMAFNHARDWADRHSDGPAWEHWAFAAIIELPALLGILLLTLWPKIGAGRKPTIPRILFGMAAILSLIVQQAYAGSSAAMSERIVAGLPSIAAAFFLEVVFWVMGLVDEAKSAAIAAATQAAVTQTRQQVGLGAITPPPTLTPPVVSPPNPAPLTPGMSPGHPVVSPLPVPLMSPDMSPAVSPPVTGHDGPASPDMSPDISQVAADVTPRRPLGNPWAEMGDIDPDIEAAKRVVALPDVAPDTTPDTDMSPDTDGPDPGADVTPTPDIGEGDAAADQPDTTPDTDTKKMTDPRWAEAAEMRRNGAIVKAIAAHFGVSERQVQRWKLPAPDTTKPANGRVPHMTGVN